MAYLRARRHYLLVTVILLLGGWIAWAVLPTTASEPMVEEEIVAAESGGEQEGNGFVQPLSAAELGRYTRLEGQPLRTFTNTDLAEFLELRSRLFVDQRSELPAANMACYALRCAEQPFRLFAGRFDLAEADCVTFVERTLAMAVSRNWTEYRVVSDRLRYKDGVATYRNRNFFTLGDWLPNNSWLLEDVTDALGASAGELTKPFSHVVRPKVFVEVEAKGPTDPGLVFKGADYSSPDKRVVNDVYVPRELMDHAMAGLRTGDVCLVIRRYERPGLVPWLDCDHMGIVLCTDLGETLLSHSAPPEPRYDPLKAFLERSPWVAGFKFLRLREKVDVIVDQVLSHRSPDDRVPSPEEEDWNVSSLRERRAR